MASPCGWYGWHFLWPLAGNEILIPHRLVSDGQFEHSVEHHATATGATAVEAEHELVEIADEMGIADGALVGPQEPTLG